MDHKTGGCHGGGRFRWTSKKNSKTTLARFSGHESIKNRKKRARLGGGGERFGGKKKDLTGIVVQDEGRLGQQRRSDLVETKERTRILH